MVDVRLARYDHLIVHATATPPGLDVDAAWVDSVHRDRGWRGCGYHAVVTRSGEVQTSDTGHATRTIGQQGAHVGDCGPGWNSRSFGVALAGGLDGAGRPQDNFTEEQRTALARFVARFLTRSPHGLHVRVLGHRDLISLTNAPPKACPCFDAPAFLRDCGVLPPERVSGAEDWPDEDRPVARRAEPMRTPRTHTVAPGQTLSEVSALYGVSVGRLARMNGLDDPGLLRAGAVLRVRP